MPDQKINVKEAIIVEGKYDKIKLASIVSSTIITTNGFRIFKDKDAQQMIRRIADKRGILIMTDVDSSGFVIRNFLKGIVSPDKIKHGYIPTIEGKEKRKSQPSKEGKLGVEGIGIDALMRSIVASGATVLEHNAEDVRPAVITKADLYELGLIGKQNSAILRKKLLLELSLPIYLSTNAMLEAIACLYTYDELCNIICSIKL